MVVLYRWPNAQAGGTGNVLETKRGICRIKIKLSPVIVLISANFIERGLVTPPEVVDHPRKVGGYGNFGIGLINGVCPAAGVAQPGFAAGKGMSVERFLRTAGIFPEALVDIFKAGIQIIAVI